MSTKMMISIDLNVVNQRRVYYVYDHGGSCIAQATSIEGIKTKVGAAIKNSLGFDSTISVRKNAPIRTESLPHEGKHL